MSTFFQYFLFLFYFLKRTHSTNRSKNRVRSCLSSTGPSRYAAFPTRLARSRISGFISEYCTSSPPRSIMLFIFDAHSLRGLIVTVNHISQRFLVRITTMTVSIAFVTLS